MKRAEMWLHHDVTTSRLVSAATSGPTSRPQPHAEAGIDLAAIAHNVQVLRQAAPGTELMAVVKADGYGHGALPVARAALRGGASVIGVATIPEALSLRAQGLVEPIVCWLWTPDEPVAEAVAAGIQIAVSSQEQLGALLGHAALSPAGRWNQAGQIPLHIAVDTGMGRNGVHQRDLAALVAAVIPAQQRKQVAVAGVMSHLACADTPDDPSIDAQRELFVAFVDQLSAAGVAPLSRHLANTAGTLARPDTHFDMVRCGLGVYGLSPLAAGAENAAASALRPAMTLRARVALTKRVPAGHGVGYGLTYRTEQETTLALLPVGYGDGIPRRAGGVGQVWLGGKRRTITGRVSMDQIVIDCGDDEVRAGDIATIFGPGSDGEPTADDWASYCDTINYEIVTRIAPRVPRTYLNS